ncbi:MAG TPA: hypothetical protein VNO86_12420 [Candidatus Binatia bacterium]|nr:hypothetical protein [Candidatus Binatia bacterium]
MLGRARLILAAAAAVVILGAVPAAAVATDPLPPPSPGPSASPEPSPVTPSGLTMAARPLLGGHARPGSWVAIAVDLANEGPPVNGELRAAAGPGRRTIFGRAVELPTNSQKREIVYVQAPSFDQQLTVSLVADDQVLARVAVEITIHDPMQLVVGVVAERPGPIAAALRGLATGTGPAPAVATLAPADLPERVEAWSALDRLVWQDVDSSALSADQLAALRAWLSGGGRLVLLGGTGGLGAIARFPDDILPYRPTATVDAPIETLRPLFGPLPETPSTVPALAGPILRGRALASVGEDAVVGEAPYGSGSVTLLGIDPTVEPIVDLKSLSAVWARLLPPRGGGVLNVVDDSGLVSALTNLPALALPPIGGLLVLLVGYIVLIGPVNYLVLRRLDRREWAWISMPLLIVGFAVAAYGYGAALRGSDVIVNEVAIATGAAGTTEGRSQVYVGVFSPSRGTYELTLPGGPLVAAPVSELFGITGTAGALDVLQGDPARIRGLSIGFGTLRAFRADLPTAVPLVEADLRVVDGIIRGRLVNRSTIRLLAPAVVFGSSAVTLPELAPGASTSIELPLSRGAFGANLADRIVGAYPAADPAQLSDAARERIVRYQVINQLTLDPFSGFSGLWLPSESPILLAWDRQPLAPVVVAGQAPRQLGTTLYYLSLPLRVEGTVAFGIDLLRPTVVANESAFFSRDPWSYSLGQGSVTIAYRTVPISGRLTASRLVVGFSIGPEIGGSAPTEIEPVGPAEPIDLCIESPCPDAAPDGLPELEIFDLVRGEWMALPHLDGGRAFAIREPGRYVDPASASVLLRFQNPRIDGIGFGFAIEIEGHVE